MGEAGADQVVPLQVNSAVPVVPEVSEAIITVPSSEVITADSQLFAPEFHCRVVAAHCVGGRELQLAPDGPEIVEPVHV
jgi:hypothetical protein